MIDNRILKQNGITDGHTSLAGIFIEKIFQRAMSGEAFTQMHENLMKSGKFVNGYMAFLSIQATLTMYAPNLPPPYKSYESFRAAKSAKKRRKRAKNVNNMNLENAKP